jgi:hypothetical protein
MYHPTRAFCLLYQSTAWSGAYPKYIIYHSTAYWHLSYPKFIKYDRTPIRQTRAFCLECTQHLIFKYFPTPIGVTCFFVSYIIQLVCSGVECTQNLLCTIIQRRSERLAFSFVIYHSTAQWRRSYPKVIMYHPTRAFCLIYQSTAWSGAYPKYIIYHSTAHWHLSYPKFIKYDPAYPKVIMYHPTSIGGSHAFRLLYINQLPGVERTQKLLCIIQRRSVGLAPIVPKIY